MHIPTIIPDAAVDAAQDAAFGIGADVDGSEVEQILKAAAPFIVAQAFRDAADDPTGRYNWGRGGYLDRLRDRADELEQS